MKFVVSKEKLLDGLQSIQNVVSTRATFPILTNVLIEASETGLQLTTTDMDISVRSSVVVQVEKPGSTTVPARRLLAVIRELPSAEIVFESDSKSTASIRCGSAKFKIYGLPSQEFPAFPQLAQSKEFRLPQQILKDGIKKTSYAMSFDDGRHIINGLLFSFKDQKLALVATDGRRMALFEHELEFLEGDSTDVVIPVKSVNELLRLLSDDQGDAVISVGDNLVSFQFGATTMVTKRVEGIYPNYRQAIPPPPKERITLGRESVLTAVRRVATLSADKSGSLRMKFGKDLITIEANTPEVGEAREDIVVAYNGEQYSNAFNPEFFMDPLKNLPDDEVYLDLIDDLSPGVFKTKSSTFLYVLMPMRVSV